jgi:ABC-type Mn2+/Zn2+ transport system ATPase subunit
VGRATTTNPAPADGAPILEARDLVLGYGAAPVLSGVTLRIGQGDYWFLLGPNGTGKTTLLRTLLGTIPALGGSVRRTTAATPAGVGFVPQRAALNPALPTTVREVVLLGLVGLAVSADEREVRLAAALDQVDLGAVARRDFWTLSGGQQQRALVARALVRRPRLLALDEPMSGVDLVAADRLLPVLAAWNREQRLTILYVTHKLAVARRYATHVALFAGGRIIAGPRDAVLVPANLEATYGVVPSDDPELGGEPRP